MIIIKFYIKIIKNITIVQFGNWVSSITPGNVLSAGVALWEGHKNRQTAEGINAANIRSQERYNQQIFAREDNAVQRRALDLKAAGINPVLAAGQAAGAGGTASAGQKSHFYEDRKFSNALEAIAKSVAIEEGRNRIAQNKLGRTIATNEEAREETRFKWDEEIHQFNMKSAEEQRQIVNAEFAAWKREQKYREDMGIYSDMTPTEKAISKVMSDWDNGKINPAAAFALLKSLTGTISTYGQHSERSGGRITLDKSGSNKRR